MVFRLKRISNSERSLQSITKTPVHNPQQLPNIVSQKRVGNSSAPLCRFELYKLHSRSIVVVFPFMSLLCASDSSPEGSLYKTKRRKTRKVRKKNREMSDVHNQIQAQSDIGWLVIPQCTQRMLMNGWRSGHVIYRIPIFVYALINKKGRLWADGINLKLLSLCASLSDCTLAAHVATMSIKYNR